MRNAHISPDSNENEYEQRTLLFAELQRWGEGEGPSYISAFPVWSHTKTNLPPPQKGQFFIKKKVDSLRMN
jgi:hypothetical protein